MVIRLCLFDGDGVFGTHLEAAFAAQALVRVHRFGFAILDFVNFDGTNIHALSATDTFVLVHDRIKSH
jgi:hypothetical protein